MQPRRFAARGRRRGATVTWTAPAAETLRLVVGRRLSGGRFKNVGTLRRSVGEGAGSMRFRGRVAGRVLRPGRYRLVRVSGAGTGCAGSSLRFTVRRG
jgi:hypothetical protein